MSRILYKKCIQPCKIDFENNINILFYINHKMSRDLFLKCINKYSGKSYSVLKVALTNSDPEFKNNYENHIMNHNNSILSDNFPNSGFDLFIPKNTIVQTGQTIATLVPLDIKCEMLDNTNGSIGYYMYARSSISKTPLMLANNVGIIDSGYRGVLMAAFRNLDLFNYTILSNTRLVQITNPSLSPIFVELVDESELSTTARGSGGFGSTGV